MKVQAIALARNGFFPNSELPVLVYHGAVPEPVTEVAVKSLFTGNDWPPQWVDTVFDYDHYHSTAHEVLGAVSGWARLVVGGPGGRPVELNPGDVVVIPAGVAHRLEESRGDFAVVGAYPPGQNWDTLKGEPGDLDKAMANLARVPMPDSDPVAGPGGPLLEHW